MNPWTQALASYRRLFGWTGWEPGYLRMGRRGFYCLPEWWDALEGRMRRAKLRAQGKCTACGMRGRHKMGCPHRPGKGAVLSVLIRERKEKEK